MIKFLKKLFRYKLVSIYMIVSQIVIFTAIFGALRIYNKAYAKENDRINAIAKNRIEMSVNSFSRRDLLSTAGKGVEYGNIVADGKLTVQLKDTNNRCEMILAINEDLPYPLVEGHIPGTVPEDSGKNVVAIGRDKCDYIYEKSGGKFILINQEEYEVVGIIGGKYSDYWDYRIVLNINCISDGLKKSICSKDEYTILLSSNLENLTDSYQKVYENIMNTDNMCVITANKLNSKGESTVSNTLQRENFKINAMVYIFCLINSVIISMFWIIQRRKELAIRKTFGMSTVRIIAGMAKDMLILMLIAFILFIIGYGILQIMAFKNTGMIEKWDWTSVFGVGVMSLVTLLVSLIYPAIDVYRNSKTIIK